MRNHTSILVLFLVISSFISSVIAGSSAIVPYGEYKIRLTGIPDPVGTYEVDVYLWQENGHIWATIKKIYNDSIGFDMSGFLEDGILKVAIILQGSTVYSYLSADLVPDSEGNLNGYFKGFLDSNEPYFRDKKVEGFVYCTRISDNPPEEFLDVEIEASKLEYEIGETATFFFRVKNRNTGAPVKAGLKILTTDNFGSRVLRFETETNLEGWYEWTITWETADSGTWKIGANVTRIGYKTASARAVVVQVGVPFKMTARPIKSPVMIFELVELEVEISWLPLSIEQAGTYHIDFQLKRSRYGTERLDIGDEYLVDVPIMVRREDVSEYPQRDVSWFPGGDAGIPANWDINIEPEDSEYILRIRLCSARAPVMANLKLFCTISPENVERPTFQSVSLKKDLKVETRIDPITVAQVREAVAKKWLKRWTELGWEGSIEEMYDVLDDYEKEINYYAAVTSLSLKFSGQPAISEVVDQMEDILDFAKAAYLFKKGYHVQAALDIFFKTIPDIGADVVGKRLPAGFALTGITIGATTATVLGLGPVGIMILTVLGGIGGYEGGEAASEALEMTAAYVENWWETNKDVILRELGAAQYENLHEWVIDNERSNSDPDVKSLKKILSILKVRSDGCLNIYDSEGRHTGIDEYGNLQAEIPGSSYLRFDESKTTFALLGAESGFDGEYRFVVVGMEAGHYSLGVLSSSQNGVASLVDTKDAELNSGAVYQSTIYANEVFNGTDSISPTLDEILLSAYEISSSHRTQNISVFSHVKDDSGAILVIASIIKGDMLFSRSFLPIYGEYCSGEIIIPAGIPEGDYSLQVSAYDRSGNAGVEEVHLTVLSDPSPRFRITDLLISPRVIVEEEIVHISANITNVGISAGNFTATLKINNQSSATQTVSLNWHESKTVSWRTTSEWTKGAYIVDIDGLTGSFAINDVVTTILLSSLPSTFSKGGSAIIGGSITPPSEDSSVKIETRRSGGTWNLLMNLLTSQDGAFSHSWTPTDSGQYEVRATLRPDKYHASATSSILSINVEEKRCIIATAAYGSELNDNVQFLRIFREQFIMTSLAGSQFMNAFNAWYYSFSPSVADIISNNVVLKEVTKIFLSPLIGILHLTTEVYSIFSQNSEVAVIMAGFTASSLIGIIYFTPIALLCLIGMNKLEKRPLRTKHLRSIGLIVLSSLVLLVAGELFLSTQIIMVSGCLFILSLIALSAGSTALIIHRRILRERSLVLHI